MPIGGQAVLDFPSSADMGRLMPTAGEDADAGSEVSEWELRERREREEERRAEQPGAEEDLSAGEGRPLFLPTPSFMASADEG